MTNEEARNAWKKLYSEIDKDNWLFVGTINPEMVALAIKALEERPQGEITNEDIQQAIKEGFANGYEMAKAKFSPKKGECRTCIHRDPEDKKCDCGAQERQGCPFPVSDDYYCKYYEKGGAE